MKRVLGVDFGRTIVDTKGKDCLSLRHDQIEPFYEAFETIRFLIKRHFEDAYIISKVSSVEATEWVRLWLEDWGFFEFTHLSRDNVFFCFARDAKAPIAESIGVTHFIDDRLEVLASMNSVPFKIHFQGGDEEDYPYFGKVEVIPASSWREVSEVVERTRFVQPKQTA